MKKKNTFLRLLLVFSIFISTVAFGMLGVFAEDEPEVVIFDDYNRAELGVTGEGGAYNSPNSAGIAIYWIQMRNVTAGIEDNALKLAMNKEAWFGEGVAFKNPDYKYIIMKVKGEKGGEEKYLTINPDAVGLKNFTELKGPDGKPIPAITTEYQDIVIDIAKSGIDLPTGFEAMHFNNTGELTVYIDEIYLSKTGVPTDISQFALEQPSVDTAAADTSAEDTAQTGAADTASDTAGSTGSLSEADNADTTAAEVAGSPADVSSGADAIKASADNHVLQISIIILIMALLIIGVIYYSFIRKPDEEK